MRIGLVYPGFSAGESDWCIPVHRALVERLAARHDVRVLALRYPHRRDRYRIGNAEVVSLGYGVRAGLHRIGLLRRALWALSRSHRERPFHVVHGFWADEPGAIAVAFGRLERVPAFVTPMGGELVALESIGYGAQRSRAGRRLSRFALGRADAVLVGATDLEARCAAIARRRLSNTRRFVLGADARRFGPSGPRQTLSGSPAILHVGSFVPVKGHAVLLEAFARVRAEMPEAVLHLAGAGAPPAELGREPAVVLHGEVPHERMPALYRGADLFVSSSVHEGHGMAALEAALSGVPIVGTRVGILPDLGLGPVVPPGDPRALARALAGLAKDPERAAAVAAAARRIGRAHDLDASVDRLEVVYRAYASLARHVQVGASGEPA